MADIFFSYSQKDEQRVRPIISALEAQGYTVWWDTHLDGGARWRAKIKTELTEARCAIVAWSELSAASDFVTDEAQLANRADKLVPLLLEPMEPPLGFGGVQALDFSNWNGKPEALVFVKLGNAVRAKLGEPLKPLPIVRPQPRWRAVAVGLFAVAGIAALSLWFLYEPHVPDPRQPDAEWPKNPPDQAYCYQRRNSPVVTPGKFLVRCFLTYELCEEFRVGDNGEKTDCRFVTNLRWTDAKKDQRPTPTWHQYSNSPIPPPFPGF